MTLDRSKTILALFSQLCRTAKMVVDADGVVSDPEVLAHHIRRHVEALAAEAELAEQRWQRAIADADGLVVDDGQSTTELVSWLEAYREG